MRKRGTRGDPFAEIKEWQDHRYDPGYFTGGRIHPVYRSSRPNKWGYVLIGSGLFPAFALVSLVQSGGPIVPAVGVFAIGALMVMAGVRLVRGPRQK